MDAWATVSKNPDLGWYRRKSTRAALVWEHAVQNAIATTEGDPNRVVLPHHDTVSFIFEDAVLFRLKKAGMDLRTSNVATGLSFLFHEPEADLFGYSGLQRVEIGYVLNRFETAPVWIGVVARDGDELLWHFELNEVAGAAKANPVLPFPSVERRPAADLASLKEKKPPEKGSGDAGQ